MVRIELFGVPRMRAGVDEVSVEATSLGEALRALAAACPVLDRGVVLGGALSRGYLVAVNGLQMTSDPATALRDGDVLVLMSADAGG